MLFWIFLILAVVLIVYLTIKYSDGSGGGSGSSWSDGGSWGGGDSGGDSGGFGGGDSGGSGSSGDF